MRKLCTLLAGLLTFLSFAANAQLATGDLAFVYFNKEEDGFALVNFVDIAANSTIYIKDEDRNGSAFVTTNSAFTWNTGASVIPAGTITIFTLSGPTVSNGSVTTTVAGIGNEPLWAFVGTDGNTPTTFLAVIGNGTNESTGFGSLSGTGLAIGSTAILLTDGIDRAKYTGARSGQNAAGYLPLLSDMANNWEQTFQPANPTTFSGIISATPSFTFGTADITPPSVTFSPAANALDFPANTNITLTFSEDIRLVNNSTLDNTNVDNVVDVRLTNASGAVVPFDATISGRVITITPSSTLSNNQLYYVALKAAVVEDHSDNVATHQSVSFTTLMPQTQFQPGDLVFVGYQMNGVPNVDRIAILTFVNILPGTLINFTDAKYTDNTPAQCSGGFTWRTPSAGISAGTVVIIENDAMTVETNKGTLTGSGFGLGQNGDQLIVYTGTPLSPSYITALSSNAWVTANTSCSGGNSKLPAGLADGQSSINLSTVLGAGSSNTPNAFYNGPQTGAVANLKASILNPVNWSGTTSGSNAQTWPSWAFPGPPSVVSTTVINQTQIKVVFSTTLDNATATDIANYTGISGLQTATLANDKEVTLTFSSPFSIAGNYALIVSGVKDTGARAMASTYTFSFTYNTTLSFDKKFISVKEDDGSVIIKLKLVNPSASSLSLVVKGAPFSSASTADFTLTTQTLNFTGSSASIVEINVPIVNDTQVEQDEYLVLSLESASGVAITGGQYMTIFIKDNDRPVPVATKSIELSYKTSYSPPEEGTAEIVVHDPASKKLFVISSIESRLDIASFADPANITHVKSVDMTPYGGITSVATKNGIVAVSSPNADLVLPGSVVFFDTDGVFQKQVTVGVLPDMITFTPDGSKVLTANEGQPNDAYTVDPEGSVSVIDISGGLSSIDQTKVTTIGFESFNAQETALITNGVRKLKLSSPLSKDFEPEYITVSADSKKAWVTLQENNAIAEVNLETKTFLSIWAMGKKDFNAFGNGIDASDNNGIVLNTNWPVKAFYIPDAIANYAVGSTQYLVTANEGDEKEYSGLNERTTVGDAGVILDPTVFPNASVLKESHNLGRLRITKLSGDTDGDGDYDELNVNGARSFTIWDAATKSKVFDSGDDIERIIAADPVYGAIFNADNEGNGLKNRSRAKGPEPEGITLASFNNKTYAFIALERVGGVMVYDVTDPSAVKFVDYKNSRSTTAYTGDHGPEGIIFISRENSPDGKRYVAVANEISGSVSVYEVTGKDDQTITFAEVPGKTFGDAAFTLTATASSGLPITFLSSDVTKASVNSNSVTLVKAGRVTITASQAGDNNFKAATAVERSFCITPAKPTVSLSNVNTGDELLTSSAESGNQWYKDGQPIAGETARTHSISAPGIYSVTVTADDCISESSNDMLIVITHVEMHNDKHALVIRPNPADHLVVIELPDQGTKEIELLNSAGIIQEVFSSKDSKAEVIVRGYASGIYFVKVKTAKGSYVSKFIKK